VQYNVACNLLRIGQLDEALDLIEKNIDLGWGNAEWLENDPDMASVRHHPRFLAILARMPRRR